MRARRVPRRTEQVNEQDRIPNGPELRRTAEAAPLLELFRESRPAEEEQEKIMMIANATGGSYEGILYSMPDNLYRYVRMGVCRSFQSPRSILGLVLLLLNLVE